MNRHATKIILAAVLLLFAMLCFLWFKSDGTIKNSHWEAPTARAVQFDGPSDLMVIGARHSTNDFLELLERPLFSPNRRPAPPPSAVVAEPVKDLPLPNITVAGLIGGDSSSAILKVDGKAKRVAVNEVVSGWTLSAVNANNITLKQGARSHTIELVHSVQGQDGAKATTSRPLSLPPAQSESRARAIRSGMRFATPPGGR